MRLAPGSESPSSSETSLTDSSQPQSARACSALTCEIDRSSSSRSANSVWLWPLHQVVPEGEELARRGPGRSVVRRSIQLLARTQVLHTRIGFSAQPLLARSRPPAQSCGPQRSGRVVRLGARHAVAARVPARRRARRARPGSTTSSPAAHSGTVTTTSTPGADGHRRRGRAAGCAKIGAQAAVARPVGGEDVDGDRARGAGARTWTTASILSSPVRSANCGWAPTNPAPEVQQRADVGGRARVLTTRSREQRLGRLLRRRRLGGGRRGQRQRHQRRGATGPASTDRATAARRRYGCNRSFCALGRRPATRRVAARIPPPVDADRVAAPAQVGAQLGGVAGVDRPGLLPHARAAPAVGLERHALGRVGQVRDDEADRAGAEAPGRHRHAVGGDGRGDDDRARRARLVAALPSPPQPAATSASEAAIHDRRGPARDCRHPVASARPLAARRGHYYRRGVSPRRRARSRAGAPAAAPRSGPPPPRTRGPRARAGRRGTASHASCSARGRALSCRGAVAVIRCLLSGRVPRTVLRSAVVPRPVCTRPPCRPERRVHMFAWTSIAPCDRGVPRRRHRDQRPRGRRVRAHGDRRGAGRRRRAARPLGDARPGARRRCRAASSASPGSRRRWSTRRRRPRRCSPTSPSSCAGACSSPTARGSTGASSSRPSPAPASPGPSPPVAVHGRARAPVPPARAPAPPAAAGRVARHRGRGHPPRARGRGDVRARLLRALRRGCAPTRRRSATPLALLRPSRPRRRARRRPTAARAIARRAPAAARPRRPDRRPRRLRRAQRRGPGHSTSASR